MEFLLNNCMKNILLIFILLFISNFCFAQQKIVFENQTTISSRSFTLPISVTCFFKDNSQQDLLLESVHGDSLIFKKYYNLPQNFDCKYSSLEKIKIHKNAERASAVLCAFLAISAIITIPASIVFLANGNAAATTTVPISIVSTLGTIALVSIPNNDFETNEWRIYAK